MQRSWWAGSARTSTTNKIDEAVAAFADDLGIVDSGMGTIDGRKRFREYLETFKRAMRDGQAVVEHRCQAADTVVVEGRFVATLTGPVASDDGDLAATGAGVDLRFADVSRVRDGVIVSYHTYYDQLGVLAQLGLIGEG